MSGTHNLSNTKASASGITEEDVKIFKSYLEGKNYKTVSYKKITRRESHTDGLDIFSKIKDVDKLIVGGFSRGSAFFVPYFLKLMLENTDRLTKLKKLIIVLMDPVHGSGHDKDKTISTLRELNLETQEHKKKLIEQLQKKLNLDLYAVIMCPGLDRRAKNFKTDYSFIEALGEKLDKNKLFRLRMGISHAVLSTWSQEPGYRSKLISSLELTRKDESKFKIGKSKEGEESIETMVKDSLDLVITKPVLDLIFYEGSLDPGLSRLIDEYQSSTNLIVNEKSLYSKVYYKFDTTGSLAYWGGNNEKDIEKCKRNIEPDKSRKLRDLLEVWKS